MKKQSMVTKGMRNLHVFCLILLVNFFGIGLGWAQGSDSFSRKLRYHAILGGGVSQFNIYELPSSPKYRTAETLVGIRASKPIGAKFSIVTGLSFGAKFKRSPYFKTDAGGPFTTEPEAIYGLDKSTSDANAYYVSLPVVLSVNLGPETNIYAGVSGRTWLSRKSDFMDVLRSLKELGLLVGSSRKINPLFSAGLEVFYGLTDIYPGAVLLPNSSRFINPNATNQSVMIFLSIALGSQQ